MTTIVGKNVVITCCCTYEGCKKVCFQSSTRKIQRARVAFSFVLLDVRKKGRSSSDQHDVLFFDLTWNPCNIVSIHFTKISKHCYNSPYQVRRAHRQDFRLRLGSKCSNVRAWSRKPMNKGWFTWFFQLFTKKLTVTRNVAALC